MKPIRHLKNTSILSTYLVLFLCFAFMLKAGEGNAFGYSPLFSQTEEGEILQASLQDGDGEVVSTGTFIDSDAQTVSMTVPEGVDQGRLALDCKVTEGFAVEPAPEEVRDFSESVSVSLEPQNGGKSTDWTMRVYDENSVKIFSGADFKHWKLRADGYEREEAFGEYLDNRDGLYFELASDLPDGLSALFYYDNNRPVERMQVQYEQPVDHHQNVNLQILDLAAVADDIAEQDWWVTDADNPDELVRWSQSLTETTGEMMVQANFSGEPLSGPIAIKYGGASKDYRINVKKVMLIFE